MKFIQVVNLSSLLKNNEVCKILLEAFGGDGISGNKEISAITSKVFLRKRTELGISQEKMAENLKISHRQYYNLEHGIKCCSLETFSNFVDSCDVDAAKILSDISAVSKLNKE